MPSPINRRAHKDIEKKVLLTSDLLKWVESHSEELDVSHSAYIRGLIAADRDRVQAELLQPETEKRSTNPDQILASLISLLTEHPELAKALKQLIGGRK